MRESEESPNTLSLKPVPVLSQGAASSATIHLWNLSCGRICLPPGARFVRPPTVIPNERIGVLDGVCSTEERVGGGRRASFHDLRSFEHGEPYKDSLEQMREHVSN